MSSRRTTRDTEGIGFLGTYDSGEREARSALPHYIHGGKIQQFQGAGAAADRHHKTWPSRLQNTNDATNAGAALAASRPHPKEFDPGIADDDDEALQLDSILGQSVGCGVA